MKRFRLLVAAAVAAGVMAAMPAASAQESCLGAEGIFVLCADPTGGTLLSECVYTGGSTCEQVTVPGPEVTRCDGVDEPKALLTIVVQVVCGAVN